MTSSSTPTSTRFLVPYGQGAARGLTVDHIGEHGTQLDKLMALGLPTVPGVSVMADSARLLCDLVAADRAVELVEELAGRSVSDPARPMLLRLSASAALPIAGLPDPISSIGFTPERAAVLDDVCGRPGETTASWLALVRTLAEHALEVDVDDLEDVMFDVTDPHDQVVAILHLCENKGSGPVPEDPAGQLALAAKALFARWDSPRAQRARKAQGVPDDLPVALHVEAVRVGPTSRSGFGSAVSRHLQTGEPGPHGTFHRGIRRAVVHDGAGVAITAESDGYAVLRHALATLERHLGTAAQVDYEVRDGELSLLAARPVARLGGVAQLRLAIDAVERHGAAVASVVPLLLPSAVEEMLHPQLLLTGAEQLFTTGLPASPGAAVGRATLSGDRVLALAEEGVPTIFVATETNPADVPAIMAASRGGHLQRWSRLARCGGGPGRRTPGRVRCRAARGRRGGGDDHRRRRDAR